MRTRITTGRRSRSALAALAVLLSTFAVVTGASPASAAVTPVSGDPLTGSGVVNRTLLTAAQLTGGTATATIADTAFALPANAAMPLHTFSGRLELTGEDTGGGFTELRDDSVTPTRWTPRASTCRRSRWSSCRTAAT